GGAHRPRGSDAAEAGDLRLPPPRPRGPPRRRPLHRDGRRPAHGRRAARRRDPGIVGDVPAVAGGGTVTAAAFVAVLAMCAATGYSWYSLRARRLVVERLADMMGAAEADEAPREELPRVVRSFPPRYRLLPASAGSIVAATLWLGARLPFEVAAAAGILVGVLSHLAEDHLAGQRSATIEIQLAEAIDLLVGSLRAGSSLLAA